MRALIPLAGRGTRLLPHSAGRQKALLPVGGRPVLDHILEPLVAAGVSEIILVVGFLGDQVREHMAGYDRAKVTFVEQTSQEGLGHAVYLGLTGGLPTGAGRGEPIVIVLADTLFELDYAAFLNTASNVIGVVEVDNPQAFGVVQTEGSRVIGMVEKPKQPRTNLAIAGIYRLDDTDSLQQALAALIKDEVKTRGEFQLTDALNNMLARGEPFQVQRVERWLDCGTPETLLATNAYLLESLGGAFVYPDAVVAGTTLRASSVMAGCLILNSTLDNCIVLPGARLERCSIRGEVIAAGARLSGYTTGG
ncbi:MAG: nucleotidyltransferase family protein [Candidatus Marinimicrobia bacterium]|nr:nucleotidyltransferase family protein [Candidatus Neomarinimicrobiota bacterium]